MALIAVLFIICITLFFIGADVKVFSVLALNLALIIVFLLPNVKNIVARASLQTPSLFFHSIGRSQSLCL